MSAALSTLPRMLPASPRPATLWTVGAAGAIAVAGAITLAVTSDQAPPPLLHGFMIGWASLPYIVSGLIAWRQRPDSRFGVLMVWSGFITLFSTLQWSGNRVLYTIGQLLDLPLAAVVLHVILAYPTGRLPATIDRIIVCTGYAAAVGLSAVVLFFGGFDPRNLLAVVPRQDIAETVQNIQLLTLCATVLAGFARLVVRRVRAGRARLRISALLTDAFGLVLVMLAALFIAGTFELSWFRPVQLATIGAIGLAPIALLIGIIDAKLARTRVVELVRNLHTDVTPDLREPIARALRDPSVQIAYWLPQYGAWTDLDGQPVTAPEDRTDRAATYIDRRGQHVAALLHDPSLSNEPQLLEAVSAAAGIALENGQLQAELHARMQELQGSRLRVLEASQAERKRLERDLHDGAQQRLVSLALELGLLEDGLKADPAARDRLSRARQEVTESLMELRDIARGIYPAVLSGHGLAVAVESMVARAPVPVELDIDLDQRVPEHVEAAAYYVIAESLTNIGKHARATEAKVRVGCEQDTLVVEITDDGIGGADTDRGSGLRGLADRVEALGGKLQIWTPKRLGTRLRAEIPCR